MYDTTLTHELSLPICGEGGVAGTKPREDVGGGLCRVGEIRDGARVAIDAKHWHWACSVMGRISAASWSCFPYCRSSSASQSDARRVL